MKIKASKEVVVCENPAESKTKTGLLYASDEKNKPELGVIYDIGSGKLPIEMKVGDTIVFRRYADNRIFIEGREYNFIRFEDIVGVIKDDRVL